MRGRYGHIVFRFDRITQMPAFLLPSPSVTTADRPGGRRGRGGRNKWRRIIVREIGVITRVAITPCRAATLFNIRARFYDGSINLRPRLPRVRYKALLFPPRAQEFSPRSEEMRYDRDSRDNENRIARN